MQIGGHPFGDCKGWVSETGRRGWGDNSAGDAAKLSADRAVRGRCHGMPAIRDTAKTALLAIAAICHLTNYQPPSPRGVAPHERLRAPQRSAAVQTSNRSREGAIAAGSASGCAGRPQERLPMVAGRGRETGGRRGRATRQPGPRIGNPGRGPQIRHRAVYFIDSSFGIRASLFFTMLAVASATTSSCAAMPSASSGVTVSSTAAASSLSQSFTPSWPQVVMSR